MNPSLLPERQTTQARRHIHFPLFRNGFYSQPRDSKTERGQRPGQLPGWQGGGGCCPQDRAGAEGDSSGVAHCGVGDVRVVGSLVVGRRAPRGQRGEAEWPKIHVRARIEGVSRQAGSNTTDGARASPIAWCASSPLRWTTSQRKGRGLGLGYRWGVREQRSRQAEREVSEEQEGSG